jgi:predicted nucleic acid-binding protein
LVLENQAAVSTPIRFELLRGARTTQQAQQLATRLDALHFFPLSETDWIEAALWARGLSESGVSAKSMDILIAFKAERHDLTLLHMDRDFDRIARTKKIKVESWVGK